MLYVLANGDLQEIVSKSIEPLNDVQKAALLRFWDTNLDRSTAMIMAKCLIMLAINDYDFDKYISHTLKTGFFTNHKGAVASYRQIYSCVKAIC